MELTHEILKEMDENFVIDFFHHVISNEIKNNVKRINNVLLISLSNGSTVQISAPKVASDTLPPVQTEAEIQNIETIRYVLLHDYGYNKESECKEINKLELHNLDECRTYIEDAVCTQLNAYFTNYLIEFMNGEKFMVSIELKQ